MRDGASPKTRARLIAAVTVVSCCAVARDGHAEAGWAPKVSAVYKLRISGLDVASFHFDSQVQGSKYTLAGYAKMGWGMGLFKYTGSFSGSGTLAGDTVRPAAYAYDWKVNARSGSVRMTYGTDSVKTVEVVPAGTPSPDVVPLEPEHLRGVLDPLSSLIALSRETGGEPCKRRVAVLEGKQRFDVVLSPFRLETVKEARPSGQPVAAHVCRVRYQPVAGHRMNRETQAMVKADGIEVALRPVPSARLLVPYRIVIPTPLGNAVLSAERVDITAPGNLQIALVR